ncbi:uncharacterized protein LY89DRAFT_752603 [Mollisia scopiformis]|uniref:Zn(2)-C6 fungal-type domain-containing protein n=1 Tax=Mollisia scopiformis TaxID=149040 RepID=A0A194X2X2_MOLSC|nr:uncharacterized protein LY89DRAFT_752603 [Mollisia scopiformis]KUJ14533.1 hypothetical protein LY89DRAFT_752603 [Mollisia scopiformis]
MSSQRRRGRGKRPRDESPHSTTHQGFTTDTHQSESTLSYSDSGVYQGQSLQSPISIGPAFSQAQILSPRNVTHAPPGKVAIPALRQPQVADSSQDHKKGRTSHACDHCRKAKAGCTGGQPCVRCKNANISCVYGDGKRDRERKKLSQLSNEANTLNQHNLDIIEALRRIQLNTTLSSESMRTAINEVLSMTPPTHNSLTEVEEAPLGSSQFSPEPEELEGEDQDSDVGSTGSLDAVNVDTDRDETRATGHLGKASAVAWAKRTAQECDTKSQKKTALGTHETGYTLASYHTEDDDVEFIDLSNVSAFDWPDYEAANTLVGLYFDSVHSILPLLDRQQFTTRYNNFARGTMNLSSDDSVWLGSLNLVFAIGAVYGQLTKRHDRGNHQDHLFYFKRAKMLCLDDDLLFRDARVSTCRMLGLLCFYFISTCRLNRAWTICGLAIRQAITLGLQVRSHVEGLSDYEKEQRVRLWWALYTLECLLNELTGRPSCVSDQDISAPLPINMNEDEFDSSSFISERSSFSSHFSHRASKDSRGSDTRPTATYQMPTGIAQALIYKFPPLSLPTTTSTYFIYRIQLCIVAHEVVTQLYCAATTKAKWSEVQDTIRRIDRRLLSWCDTLPQEFSIIFDKWTEPDWNDPYIFQRLGLAMIFNSSRMILYRPCLCRFERRVESHSKRSQDFNQEGAEKCIHSARTMISLMHWSASSVEKLYAITPWWNTLHYLCEALSVLMLEMAFQAQHLPNEAAYILDDAKSGIRWLRTMAGESVSARKAWEIFDCLIRLVAPMISWSVFDMPTEAPIPAGYNYGRFTSAAAMPSRRLNAANLHEFQSGSNIVDQPAATTAWNQDQNFVAFSAPSDEQAGFGFAGGGQGFEQVRNPLDHGTAVELFGSIGRVHGHYDEPWQHMFGGGGGGGGEEIEESGVGEPDQGIIGPGGFEGFGGQGQEEGGVGF